jgi:hypothetical protein
MTWAVAIGIAATFGLSGLMIGGILAMYAMRSASKSGDPIPVFGVWMRVIPVWQLDSDRLWHANTVMGRVILEIVVSLSRCEEECERDNVMLMMADPHVADHEDVLAMAEFVYSTRRVIESAGLAPISEAE